MPRSIIALFGAFALVIASCGDDDETADTTTTTPEATTSTEVTTTTAPDPTDGWERCENPEGFSIAYPGDWTTNDGSVTEPCSLFDPEAFEVPEATDARVAAVSAYVDDVPFNEVAAPEAGEDHATTVVDGHQAVRTEGPAGEFYGDHTQRAAYAIDLALGVDDGPGTLFVDVVDVDDVAYDDAVSVLDRMVKTIDLDVEDQSETDVVVRYEGAAPWTARLGERGGDPCVTAPATDEGTTECFTTASANALRFADFSGDLFSAMGGVTGDAVFRVDITTDSGQLSYLPVTPGAGEQDSPDGIRGWAVPIPLDSVEQITWSDIDGEQLGARVVDEEDGVGAVGSFESTPIQTEGFPVSGRASYLTDVRVAGHDGFDRIVFEFGERNDDVSYSVEVVDSVTQGSGEEVSVDGAVTLELVMTPASGVDLSGEEPRVTYDGAQRIDPSTTSAVEELVAAEDFESTFTWAIGLAGERDVAVTTLADPYRVVVDVRAG